MSSLTGALLQQIGKPVRGLLQKRNVGYGPDGFVLLAELLVVDDLRIADNDAARIEVIVQCLALAQELRGEQQIEPLEPLMIILYVERTAIPDGDRRLDDHHGFGIDRQHQIDHLLHMARIEIVLDGIIVRRRGNDHELRIAIGGRPVERGLQMQRFFRQILFDVLVLNGRLTAVYQIYLLGNDIHGHDLMMLGQERGDGQAHIAGSGNCYLHILF